MSDTEPQQPNTMKKARTLVTLAISACVLFAAGVKLKEVSHLSHAMEGIVSPRRLSTAFDSDGKHVETLKSELTAREKLFKDAPENEVKYWFEYSGPLQVSHVIIPDELAKSDRTFEKFCCVSFLHVLLCILSTLSLYNNVANISYNIILTFCRNISVKNVMLFSNCYLLLIFSLQLQLFWPGQLDGCILFRHSWFVLPNISLL
mmetsp:Transcript_24339/g.55514  ORF Transcript_24339/g.55514 Transcript_24339/m.55514 type:complete len:204 (+) Transcript_24339:159-770(+)